MGGDQLIELEPSIEKVFAEARLGKSWCATFTFADDADRWIQVTRNELNMAYPYDVEPASQMAGLVLPDAANLSLLDWEAQTYATFTYSEELSPREVAGIADALLLHVVGTEPDYDVDVELFEIPLSTRPRTTET